MALLPAAQARCTECLKLMAKPGVYQYDKPEEQMLLTGFSPTQRVLKILRNSYTTPQKSSTLQEKCKAVQVLSCSSLSMYLALNKLPLPRRLIKFIWEVMEEEAKSQAFVEFQDMWDSPY